jgi:hypothetical protein
MATSAPSAASLSEVARSEAMADDDATQLSGREAQRLAGIARQAHPAVNAHQVAASHAAAQRRTEEAMPAEERLRRRREHEAKVYASKRQKKELTAELHADALTGMDLLNELLAADGYDGINEEDMYAFQDWLESEGHQLRAGDEVKLAQLCSHAHALVLAPSTRALCSHMHAPCAHVHTPCARVHAPCAHTCRRSVLSRARSHVLALCTRAHAPCYSVLARAHALCTRTPRACALCTRAYALCTRACALCLHAHVPCARDDVPDR